MSWIKRSPFRDQADAARHMVDLLAAEGELRGTRITDDEREMLAGSLPISEELSSKTRQLIRHIFENQTEDPDPRSFSGSMGWASDGASSNVVDLTWQVVDGLKPTARVQGWARIKDKIALIGCGLLVVLLVFAGLTAAGFIFHWK